MSAIPRSGPTTTPAIHALLDFFFFCEGSGITVGSGLRLGPPVTVAVEGRLCMEARNGQYTGSKNLLSWNVLVVIFASVGSLR